MIHYDITLRTQLLILNASLCATTDSKFIVLFISPLFNQVGQLRTSYHLQLQPGQDKASSATKTTTRVTHKQTYKSDIFTFDILQVKIPFSEKKIRIGLPV